MAKESILPESFILNYNLFELPTTQHKSGLVGLVLMIRHLHNLKISKDDIDILSIDKHNVSFKFTQKGMIELFNKTYEAFLGECKSKTKWKDDNKQTIEPIRIDEIEVDGKNGKKKKEKLYIYPKVFPFGAFLPYLDPEGPDGIWTKLWRDMLWQIPRGAPLSRIPFNNFSKNKSIDDGIEVYENLALNKNKEVVLTGTFLLGIQKATAEGIEYKDINKYQFLLNFWMFVSEIFVPYFIDTEGSKTFNGYVLTFPDIIDLENYCDDYIELLKNRSVDKFAYLPKNAVIDLPLEGGLKSMQNISNIIKSKVQINNEISLNDLILSIDIIHASKEGDSVKILYQNKIDSDIFINNEYDKISKIEFWSYSFRKQILINIINKSKWYNNFIKVINSIQIKRSEKGGYMTEFEKFAHDARKMLETEKDNLDKENTINLNTTIYKIVTNYLTGMLNSKYGLVWNDSYSNEDKYNYRDKKSKIAMNALLAIRSRNTNDFVKYVSTNIFSISQMMKKEEYLFVTDKLLNDTENFKIILMLAFSAQMPY